MKTIAILGGSFDPPHIGHAVLAETVMGSGEVDEVWMMPAKRNPLKPDTLASDTSRMEMVELLASQLDGGIFSSSYEISRPGTEPSYTYQTLRELKARFPEVSFKWIVGMDCVDQYSWELRGWRNATEIMHEFGYFLVSRGGYLQRAHMKDVPEGIFYIDPDVQVTVSSTYLRSKLLRGDYKGLKTLLTEPVLDYIRSKGLYLPKP